MAKKKNRYRQIIERIFFSHYEEGKTRFIFQRPEIEMAANDLNIKLPKNIGDVLYSFRYRADLPESIKAKAPQGMTWVILPAGRSRYRFTLVQDNPLLPNVNLVKTKVPDSTPGIIERYALNDEQALLAKVRYNRLIDIFTGVTCYSLQNHLRTTVVDMGQVETDEIYIGVDKRGVQYVFPVQAKGGKDRLSIVQIVQDFGLCAEKFPNLVCIAIGAYFVEKENTIALFAFEQIGEDVKVSQERHYRLVSSNEISDEDLEIYRNRLEPT